MTFIQMTLIINSILQLFLVKNEYNVIVDTKDNFGEEFVSVFW